MTGWKMKWNIFLKVIKEKNIATILDNKQKNNWVILVGQDLTRVMANNRKKLQIESELCCSFQNIAFILRKTVNLAR